MSTDLNAVVASPGCGPENTESAALDRNAMKTNKQKFVNRRFMVVCMDSGSPSNTTTKRWMRPIFS
jgi:hypothetical protein